MGRRTRASLALLLALGLLAACDSGPAGAGGGDRPGSSVFETPYYPGGAARPVPEYTSSPPSGGGGGPAAAFTLTIRTARFGLLTVGTLAGARCAASGVYPSGARVTAPELAVPQTAGSGGTITWQYQATTRENGQGSYTVTCTSGGQSRTATAAFTVP